MISALTFNGINYLSGGSAKQFVSMDASWENNFRPASFPARALRMAIRSRDASSGRPRLRGSVCWCAVQYGSTEYSNLINLTTGTATVHGDARC